MLDPTKLPVPATQDPGDWDAAFRSVVFLFCLFRLFRLFCEIEISDTLLFIRKIVVDTIVK